MSKFSAADIPGNRLEIQKQVTVYEGYPGSNRTEVWEPGFVTPQVFSFVEEPDGLYWQIGELAPIRYVKHDAGALDVVPDSGGAEYVTDSPSGGGNIDVAFAVFSELFDAGNWTQILKLAALAIAAMIGFKLYGLYSGLNN